MHTIDAVAESIAQATKGLVGRAVDGRVADLEARIAEIPAGPAGPGGEPGINGKDGAPGEPGITGKDGEPGAPGERGEKGEQGPQGEPGGQGDAGQPGEKGEPGQDGRDGLAGKDGAPGRDAFEIDVRDGIDAEKSYPRGTFAAHDGGLIHATRSTDPIENGDLERAGWKVILMGITTFVAKPRDERSWDLEVAFTGGRRKDLLLLQLPVMLYRGVWRQEGHEEKDYSIGDTVTYDGSLWHCEQPTKAKPGASPDWKLIVKRGRDGRDAGTVPKATPVVTLK